MSLRKPQHFDSQQHGASNDLPQQTLTNRFATADTLTEPPQAKFVEAVFWFEQKVIPPIVIPRSTAFAEK
jgi:hypothetical protein